ncbi:MAG: leucine-rich repeat protein [Bacteroidales bacterium]|nr:leucine-rich repeat protein [Bacteroidales bacterium]
MTIASKLQSIIDSKAAIKTAIEAKGVDMEGVSLPAYANKIAQIQTTGGTGDHLVRFIDFDGTILKEQWVNTGESASPPETPIHDFLIFQEWNHSYDDIQNTTDIGAIYVTSNGHTYLFIKLTSGTGLTPSLFLKKSNTSILTIYDDITNEILATNSISGNVTITLSFASYGEYRIRIESEGLFGIGHGTSSSGLLSSGAYSIALQKIFIGTMVRDLNSYSFYTCNALQIISLSNSINNCYSHIFNRCFSLRAVNFPSSVSSFSASIFYLCYSILCVTMPATIINLPTAFFDSCYSIAQLNLPASITFLNDYSIRRIFTILNFSFPKFTTQILSECLKDCYGLRKVILPSTILNIGARTFEYCNSLSTIIIYATNPPTLGTNALNHYGLNMKIYVPDDSVSAYQSATNWVSWANAIYPLSSKPADL